jgi:cytidylate kinase
LGYPVKGEDFPQIAALRLGTTQEDVEAVESRPPSFAERILENLGSASPEVHVAVAPRTFEDEVRKEIEKATLEAAELRDVIILGGFANMTLRDRPKKLSVFLHAQLPYRVARVQASLGMSAEQARTEIARVEEQRRRWAKVYYDLEWGSAWYYDLAIDVSQLGIPGTARVIATAARERQRG